MLARMSGESRQVAGEWFEQVWNQQDESAIDRLFAADGRCYGFPDPETVLVGPEAFKPVYRTFCAAFSGIRIEIDDVIAEGDRVAVRWHATMAHTGDNLGFAASGRKATLAGSSIIVVRGGQIVEGWNHMDLGTLFQRLQAPAA